MRLINYISVLGIIILFASESRGQSLPVGTISLEDYYRRSQLAGQLDSTISFTVRPINPRLIKGVKDGFYPDSSEKRHNILETEAYFQSKDGKLKGSFLPLSFQTQINSHHPYGWNDGAMIPAKGLQAMLSGGVYAEYGILSVQLRPEIVLAANSSFETFDKDHYDIIKARYYDFYNKIDLPARFGSGEYSKIYWGQSSIRLNYKAMSLGLSTENLWWGPGMRNSLLMSNTAPGFKHITINTRKPIKTAIGSFEGQVIAGRLEGSGYGPLEPNIEYLGSALYQPKPNDWRYLSGMVLTWQPKWVPGLFLGFTRSSQTYSKDLSGLTDYLPIFSTIKKVKADEPINKRDQRSSLFFRWLWTEEQAEVYFELGRNNYSGSLRDRVLEPNVSRAYIFGLRKLLPINKSLDEGIMINLEVTQMAETSVDKIKTASGWYTSESVRHGYTNRGESLGAGIGPGSNLQSLDISWVKGLKRLSIQFERFLHNDDFYYYAYVDSQDPRRHWTDISAAVSGEWNYKNFIFNAKLQGIKSLNYQWYLFQEPTANTYWVNGRDAFNVQFQMGLTYRF